MRKVLKNEGVQAFLASLICILIGILIGATDVVSEEAFKLSLEEKFKEKKPEILEMNLKALSKGLEIGKKYKE